MADKIEFTTEIIEAELELAEKATPRPWWLGTHDGDLDDIQSFMAACAAFYPDSRRLFMVGAGPIPDNFVADGSEPTLIPAITGNGPTSEANHEYIAAAANNYPAALYEILNLRSRGDLMAEFIGVFLTWLRTEAGANAIPNEPDWFEPLWDAYRGWLNYRKNQ